MECTCHPCVRTFFDIVWPHRIRPPVKRDIPTLCKTFMEANRKHLRELNLRLSLLQHLLHLLECRLLGRFTFLSCMEYFDTGKWPK